MNKSYKSILALCLASSLAQASVLYDWDSATTGEKIPDGMAGVWGSVEAKGVSDLKSASGPNSAYMATDFDGGSGFKLVMQSGALSLDLTGGSVSVNLAGNVDLSNAASVGFHLWDGTGTEWGTTAADRVGVSASFQSFTQSMDYLTTWTQYSVIDWGTDSAVSPEDIVAIGLDVFDAGGAALAGSVIYVDDLAGIEAIPEPSSVVMVVLGGTGILFARRKLIN